MAKSIDAMSSNQLYELARKREAEEKEHEQEKVKAEVEELRNKRRAVKAKYKKELDAIDRKIKAMGGAVVRRSRRGGKRSGVSDQVLSIIKQHGPIKTADLRSKLESAGADVTNLGQTLAYLKKRGAVQSPQRAVYSIA